MWVEDWCMMSLKVSDMDIKLESIELLGKGVRAYRIIQESLPEGTSLPEPKPSELTEKARMLGSRLREQTIKSRESLTDIPNGQNLY